MLKIEPRIIINYKTYAQGIGNRAVKLARIAEKVSRGYDAYIGGPATKIVDIAAGTIIAQEAGATITDKKGNAPNLFENSSLVASNGLLHKEILELIK